MEGSLGRPIRLAEVPTMALRTSVGPAVTLTHLVADVVRSGSRLPIARVAPLPRSGAGRLGQPFTSHVSALFMTPAYGASTHTPCW
ncbi:MAG: hypothetical protein QOG16_120 [Actinomycetota bacterium]|nr:hypothetical protein [Actinomycetota bacterium]